MTEKQLILDEEKIKKALESFRSIDNFTRIWLRINHPESSLLQECDTMLFVDKKLGSNFMPTKEAVELINSILGVEKIVKKADIIDFNKLHERLQKELTLLTGRKQKNVDGKWAFLPNSVDLKARLMDFNKLYKVDNWERIEKLLILHVQKAHKANFEKVRLIKYYILGQNGKGSDLFTDYEGYNEKEVVEVKKMNNQVFDL